MDKSAPPQPTSQQSRKRAAILDGARSVFLRDGLEAGTMDDVAAAAGVGKQTLYRHFGSKEALFVGLVERMCAEAASAAAPRDEHERRPVTDELRELGWLLVRHLTTQDNIRLFRANVAAAGRHPELGRLFYGYGPKLARGMVAEILRRQFDQRVAETRAPTFVQLVLGDAYLEMTLGSEPPNAKARFKRQIEEAIEAVLR